MTSQSEHAPDGMYPEFEKSPSRRAFLQLGLAAVAGATAGLLADGKKLSDAEAIKVRNAKAKQFIDFLENNSQVLEDGGVEKFLISVLQEQGGRQSGSVEPSLDEKGLRSLLGHSRSEVAVLAATVLCHDHGGTLDKDPKLVNAIATIFIPHALYRVEEMKPAGETFVEMTRTMRFKLSRAIRPLSERLADTVGRGSKKGLLNTSLLWTGLDPADHARFVGVSGLGFVATKQNGGIDALDVLAKKRDIFELAKRAKTDAVSAEIVRRNSSMRQSDGDE